MQASALPLGYGAKKEGLHVLSDGLTPLLKAGNRTRTGDPHLGKVVLYQLSYSRDSQKGARDTTPEGPKSFPEAPENDRWNLEKA